MSQPYLGQIAMFAGNFAPRNWAFCNGQLLAIQANTALFSLLGTTYGGNGTTTFALPNLQSCVPMHWGPGPGLTARVLGQTVGAPSTTLAVSNLPAHSHAIMASSAAATTRTPASGSLATNGRNQEIYTTGIPATPMLASSIGSSGNGQAFSNLQPFVCISFIIATVGVFPSRN